MTEPIIIYTDGGCQHNPGGPMGIGVVLRYGSRVKIYSESLGNGTNNIAELTAILRALELLKTTDIPVIIHTDSKYAIDVLTGRYRAKKNRELILKIQALMRKFKSVKFKKVMGHKGVPDNELVDELAGKAIRGETVNEVWEE